MTYRECQDTPRAADSHAIRIVHCAVFLGGMTKKAQNVQEFHGAKCIFYKEVRVEKG